ncbi:MAG: hypothetical protein GTN62_06970 [Gemmatimonadales bacterium]|nr:hypothetical protein [Gemmatimonadales bacterium]NIN11241.1 hypothetical protein [Gemmatimonadales bacterium]NIN49840.1 hypothetical protein [Gemmatimonadales bacterium]NIP07304.1 hypothetical protein [Gemmatimonadales bacterium]NIR02999.1 hypothetical protein [Gemmatimonadales bacterium]
MTGTIPHSLRAQLGRVIDVATLGALVVAVWMFISRDDNARQAGASLPELQPAVVPVNVVDEQSARARLFDDADSGAYLVMVFRTDCPVCDAQKEGWIALASTARSRGVESVALTPQRLTGSVAEYFEPAPIPVLKVEEPTALWSSLGTRVVPTTLVIGRDDRVWFRHMGLLHAEAAALAQVALERVSREGD